MAEAELRIPPRKLQDKVGMNNQLPKDFLFGAATASYQVEGAAAEDGKGPSVWDTFAHNPGKIYNNHNADVSCDQYHLYKDDVALMKKLGLKAYRFSISWSRVLPKGRGEVNPAGLAYYSNLVDELLASGIEPWVTLFHWDFPQALQDEYKGWLSRKSVDDFAEYAALMVRTLGDRVTHWFTMNEFFCFTDKSSLLHEFAPDFAATKKQAAQIRHHALLAHGMAVKAIRQNSPGPVLVGVAENPNCTIPVIETPGHIDAARRAFREINCQFLVPLMEGAYDAHYLASLGADAPEIEAGDMETIGIKLDFFGLNMYTPVYVRANEAGGYEIIDHADDHPRAKPQWLRINPAIGYWTTRFIHELYRVDAIYITENGCAFEDALTEKGEILDTARVMYLREHLRGLLRATRDGVPVKGYFLWSLLDNFEWADGFSQRFGIVHVDYETKKRTPKLSAQYYSEVIKNNALV